MKPPITRRDFLKMASLAPLGVASAPLLKRSVPSGSGQNVIVIVLDALSAYHLSIEGYPRETMPNLTRAASRAIVYHNHYAAGNYTTPGTASLLTGTYPWTHRAFESDGRVTERFVTRNLFSAFSDYHRLAYTHNPWANTLLTQFKANIEDLIPWRTYFLRSNDLLVESLFAGDRDAASVSWARATNLKDYGYAYSLFLSHVYQAVQGGRSAELNQVFPRGLPTIKPDDDFLLEHAVEGIANVLRSAPQPFLGYFHFLPPHDPYRTSVEFYDRFRNDGFAPVFKPEDAFTLRVAPQVLARKRTEYDEFLLYADREFGRLLAALEAMDLLANSWVVLTSDHGELFERGQIGHGTPALWEAVVRVPLVILEPGRQSRTEVRAVTSAVDLLPTLARITGHPVPEWTEGRILPPFAEARSESDPPIYAIQARHNRPLSPLTSASTMLVNGRRKLLYLFGYPQRDVTELVQMYDVREDPEELRDLAALQGAEAQELLRQLKARIQQADTPYM